ncbi:glycosyl hydrolase [Paenibacillus sp. BK033]|uniref:glycosyl hydrolase n=1 Tax=Paenibacillus sp. BK033 TaxID=2512133 RepID=UPI00104D6CCA|nr:glycosyl hydrolase [Paenibacillus sp. BK033]
MNKAKNRSTALMAAALSAALLFQGTIQAAGLPLKSSYSVPLQAVVQEGAHWASGALSRWAGYGVIKGFADGSLHPDDKVTRAELATILNRLFGYYAKSGNTFADIPGGAWYADALSIARKAGYYEGVPGNLSKASAAVTREDAAVFLARVLELSAPEPTGQLPFADSAQISAYARGPVLALGGTLKGYADGTFRPNAEMTRAELVTVIDRLVGQLYQEAGTVSGGKLESHVIINQPGVMLKNAAISGNLYLAPGIADGEASLEAVQVKGNTFISGGGDHSVHIGQATLSGLIVNRAEGKVRVVVSGDSAVQSLSLNSAGEIVVDGESTVHSITIGTEASGSTLTLQATTGEVTINLLGGNAVINGQTITAAGSYEWKNGKLLSGTLTGTGSAPGTAAATANLVDADATGETKSLFAFLQDTRGKEVLFGHQHDTTVSIAGKDGDGNIISDVNNDVGDYPAVFGWDTLSLEGRENPPGVAGDAEASRAGLSAAMKRAYALGGIVTLSTHPYNFVTGGNFNDTGNSVGAAESVVTRILPGGDKNGEFKQYLDRIAALANGLKDDRGRLIPVLFRPFHEQNGSWFWWGASTTAKAEYAELYRYTVEYLRDARHVRNFLYVYSPNGPFNGNEDEYLTTYPGDEYVDILGMDQYDNKDNAGGDAFLGGLVKDLKMISRLADRKGKIATLSEYGYSAQGMKTTGNNELQWFTKVMNAIKNDPDAKRIAYMLTWANFGEGNNLFVPYKDAAGKGNHELLQDFIRYYDDPYTAFARDIRSDNVYGRTLQTAEERPFLHIVSPTNVGTVTEAPAVIRAKVIHAAPAKVTYTAGDSGTEAEMKLDGDGYYAGAWLPEASLNGKSALITVHAYLPGGAKLEQTISVFVKVPELDVKRFTFEQEGDMSDVQNNGTYPSSIEMALEHKALDGKGMLGLTVSRGLAAGDTWQELKLQLTGDGLRGVNLSRVKRLKLSALLPSALGQDGAVQAVAMYPEDWGTKYGGNATKRSLSELEPITVNGTVYYRYEAVIDLNSEAAAAQASGLAVSLVGSGLSASGPITVLIDEIGLYNTYAAPVRDTGLIDDYEGYGGAGDALKAKYPKAGGDDIRVSLSGEAKSAGEYGMKLEYAVGTAGYTGVGKSLGTVDWSGDNALSLWIKTDDAGAFAKDGKPLKLVVQLMINGTAYEAYPALAPSEEYSLTIPFADFAVAPWSSGGPVTKEALKSVTSFNLYINAMDGGSHSGSLGFDEIRAVSAAGLPELPGAAEQPGTPTGLLYSFQAAGDVTGWTLENNTASAKDIGFDEEEGTLTVDFPLVNTGQNPATHAWNEEFELTINPSALNLTGKNSLTAAVRLSEGSAKARIFIKSGSGWTWVDSGAPSAVSAAEYTPLTLSLKDAAQVAGVDLKDIKVIGIKLEELGSSGASAKLHLRQISLQ